jgi:hypothetical protein
MAVGSPGTGADGFGGKSGVVFAPAGAPVSGGATGRGAGRSPEGGGVRAIVGIGFVTAVDQAGGTFVAGAGSNWPEVCIGSVVAAETLGRGVGVIFPVAGFNGLGGRLMRKVSRLGAEGSLPSGLDSAIFMRFYSYLIKCSIAKFAIVTVLSLYLARPCQRLGFRRSCPPRFPLRRRKAQQFQNPVQVGR